MNDETLYKLPSYLLLSHAHHFAGGHFPCTDVFHLDRVSQSWWAWPISSQGEEEERAVAVPRISSPPMHRVKHVHGDRSLGHCDSNVWHCLHALTVRDGGVEGLRARNQLERALRCLGIDKTHLPGWVGSTAVQQGRGILV